MSTLNSILGYTSESRAKRTEAEAQYWVDPHHYRELDTAWAHFKHLAMQMKPAAGLDQQGQRTAKNVISTMITKVHELDAKIESLGDEAT